LLSAPIKRACECHLHAGMRTSFAEFCLFFLADSVLGIVSFLLHRSFLTQTNRKQLPVQLDASLLPLTEEG